MAGTSGPGHRPLLCCVVRAAQRLTERVPQCLQNFWCGSPFVPQFWQKIVSSTVSASSAAAGAGAGGGVAAAGAGGGVDGAGLGGGRCRLAGRRPGGAAGVQHRGAGRARRRTRDRPAAGSPGRAGGGPPYAWLGLVALLPLFFLPRQRAGARRPRIARSTSTPTTMPMISPMLLPPSSLDSCAGGSGRSCAFSRYSLASSFVGWLSTTDSSFSTAVGLVAGEEGVEPGAVVLRVLAELARRCRRRRAARASVETGRTKLNCWVSMSLLMPKLLKPDDLAVEVHRRPAAHAAGDGRGDLVDGRAGRWTRSSSS